MDPEIHGETVVDQANRTLPLLSHIDVYKRASQYGDIATMQNAIDVDMINPNTKDHEDCSLLHWAAINNRVGIVKMLIKAGADVNITGGNLVEIPLQWAVRSAFCLRFVILHNQYLLQYSFGCINFMCDI
jgi:ankyrin repeat protein